GGWARGGGGGARGHPEEEGGRAVGEPHCDDAECSAAVEGEPHQCDVAQGIPELTRTDGAEEEPEVPAAEQRERGRALRPGELALAGIVENGVRHRSSPSTLGWMPSRKQRRRREKTCRHEYGFGTYDE